MIVSFIVRNLKLGYVPGPPLYRETKKIKTHGLLIDDLKIYTAGKTQVEKVMRQVTVLMRSIGLSLGMDKCAILAVERGKVKLGYIMKPTTAQGTLLQTSENIISE